MHFNHLGTVYILLEEVIIKLNVTAEDLSNRIMMKRVTEFVSNAKNILCM
jgi:hypothetical protein